VQTSVILLIDLFLFICRRNSKVAPGAVTGRRPFAFLLSCCGPSSRGSLRSVPVCPAVLVMYECQYA
jgi:hypothetical protein